MSFDHVRQVVEAKFNDNWTATPVAYENVSFDSQAQDEWIRVKVLDGDSFKAGAGPDCTMIRHSGEVAVQVFTDQWTGSKSARDYADTISALFSNTVQSNIRFSQARVNSEGHSEDVYQLNLYIPYIYDSP